MRPFSRWCVWIGAGLSGVTGVVYWWMLNMLEPMSEFAVINHPLQPWMLKAHIVTSPLLVFALGLIAVDHVWKQYRLGIRAGRRSGTTAMWVFVPMVVSGYLVQAVTTPIWLTATVWLHLGTSMVFLVGLAAHQVAVPRRRARRGAREVDLTVVRDEGPSGSPIRSPSRKRARVRAERS